MRILSQIGQIILVAWLLVALFTFFGNVLKNSFAARIVEKHQRRLGVLSVSLMMTWIALLVLSGLFA